MTEQMTIEHAMARADEGVQRSAEATARLDAAWGADALALVRIGAKILTAKGKPQFTIEDIRATVNGAIREPKDRRAWGSVTRAAVAAGYIVRVPGTFAAATSSNMAPKPVYARGAAA